MPRRLQRGDGGIWWGVVCDAAAGEMHSTAQHLQLKICALLVLLVVMCMAGSRRAAAAECTVTATL